MQGILLLAVKINYIICINDAKEQDTHYSELYKLDISCSYTQAIANIFFDDANVFAPNMYEPTIGPCNSCLRKEPILNLKHSQFQTIQQVLSSGQHLCLKEHQSYNRKIPNDISTERYVQKNSFNKQNLKDALVAGSSILVSSNKLLNQIASYLILYILFDILHSKHTNKIISLHLLIILFASHCFYDVSADYIDHNFVNHHEHIGLDNALGYFKIKNCTFTSCQDLNTGGGALQLYIAGSAQVFIINSTFTECITHTKGGAIYATIRVYGTLTISDSSSFVRCHADEYGGGIYAEIEDTTSKLIIREVVIFDNCDANVGGGISVKITRYGQFDAQMLHVKECTSIENAGGFYANLASRSSVIFSNDCEFVNCSTSGSGGAMYFLLNFQSPLTIFFQDVAIHECKSYNSTSQYALSGFGGGIFINSPLGYDVSSRGLNFNGMKFFNNYAEKHGQSMYIVMPGLKQFCQMGIDGEYVKGNYSDYHSNKEELVGSDISYSVFYLKSQNDIERDQKYLEDLWDVPYGSIWHVSNRVGAYTRGIDQTGCATIYSPCNTIEYALIQISVEKELSPTTPTSEKRIGITSSAFELNSPIQFNPSTSYTNVIKIMKQLYGTPTPMSGQAYLIMKKGGSSSTIENGQSGWISAIGGIELRMYEIGITTDQSIFTIPIIYVQDSYTLLELDTVTFYGINLSPTAATGAKGIVHINVNNQHLIAQNSVFENISIQGVGGNAIRFENNANSRVTATITNCQFKNINAKADSNGRGGSAIFAQQRDYGSLIIDNNCQFIQCISNKGNGGAIYIDIDFNSLFQFKINNTLIKQCQATAATTLAYPTGYGGGIFLTGTGDYDISSPPKLDFSGMRILGNTANKAGQSLYVATTELQKWCHQGTLGQFVKGNYSDGISYQNELEGIPISFDQFLILSTELFVKYQRPLEYFWTNPQDDIWHIQSGTVQSITPEDQYNCGNIDEPCNTIEYTLNEISFRKGTSQTSIISEKKIGITEGGFELINPFEFNQLSYTPIIKLMKQMYGTSSAMNDNAQLKIQKGSNDSNIESGKHGWILAFGGIELRMYEIDITTDQSILTIPVIYIQDSNTLLELDTVTFSGINLSPTSATGAKGIVHINVNNQHLIAQNSIFEDITIEGEGGNAIRFDNNANSRITASITNCSFQNINAKADSNGRGGSALFAELVDQSSLIIDINCQFIQCISTKGNGGALYIDIDFNSLSEFKINDALIKDCQTTADPTLAYPTGYGGGIFLTGTGDYDISSPPKLDFSGMRILGNTANKAGQSLYVIMSKLKELCRYGNAGQYVKGNYSDGISYQNELEGIPISFDQFLILTTEQFVKQQKPLEYFWTNPQDDIWHLQTGTDQSIEREAQQWCGNIDEPCNTIEYALEYISVRKGGSQSSIIPIKKIGITEGGFELINPFEFNQQSYTPIIKLMKQMYGTSSAINGNAEIKIKKNNDDSKEVLKQGWISAVGGIELRMYEIDITTDQSNLTIPVIYVQDSNTLLELNTVTFSGINLSPTSATGAKGIVHINVNNQHLIAQNSIFEDITIEGEGGNAIRFENNQQQTFTATLTNCQFKNINSTGESNGRGGSAIFAEIQSNCELVISGITQFDSCISTQSSGGAIYAIISGENSDLILQDSISYVNCQGASGGGISTVIIDGGSLSINGITSFNGCISTVQHGGGIHALIEGENSQILITAALTFDWCESNQNGGGIYASIQNKGTLAITQPLNIHDCSASNGGAMYLNIDFSTQIQFILTNAEILQCHAIEDPTLIYPTGYGGGIFLTGTGDFDVQSNSLNLKGINISENSADKGGQSIYIIMSQLKELCRIGIDGEYVKGNYSDAESNENELQGTPITFEQFLSLPSDQIQHIQISLKYYWALPQQDIWYIQSGTAQSIISEDQYYCGKIDEPCESIEHALKQISVRKGGSESSDVSEKQIRITEGGFELTNPIELNPSITHTNKIIIMKQLYGTSSAMNDNAQLKIQKGGNDSNIENGKQGWMSVIQQRLYLQLQFINIITDQSKLIIPIIYIDGLNSFLELNSVTFSGVNLSPTSEAKGIIHININNQQFNIQNCSFEDIQIENKGGNTIRLMNDNSFPFSSIIKNTLFKNIHSVCDSKGQGGSAIYAEIRDKTKIIFDDNCQFIQCVSNQGNGGAMHLDIDFESQFFFIINNTLIQDCQAKADSTSSYPSGYGGGIFLTGYGDYSTYQNLLYFKGLKIYGNIADYGGQSLYVSMINVVEWCKFGDFGEYVKGNYSDAYSNLSDIEGIAVNQSTFKFFTHQEIQSQQQSLQYYWAHLATLSNINAVINESNIDQPLHFIIKGSNMISGKLCVKIIEVGDKMINNNKLNQHYINMNSISSNFFIASQTSDLQLNKKIPYINSFEMIYPPDDEITSSILIEGKPQSEQIATFGMKDYSWFDSSKQYSALISNDRKIFTGAEGKENQSIQLEINIDKPIDSPDEHKIAWWIILLIIVAGVILISVVIVIIYLCCFRRKSIKKSKKNDQEEIEKQQFRQQTNEIEMNAEDEKPKNDERIKKNSSKPEHDEIDQLIQKEPYQKFNSQISPQTISSPPTQQLQIQNPNQHSDQDLTPIDPSRQNIIPDKPSGSNIISVNKSGQNNTPIDPSGQNITPDKPSGSNIIPVNNSGSNITPDKHSVLNLTPDKPQGSILTPIAPSPSISSQSHHPTSNQQPIRSSSPGQSQKLQTARSLYPSNPNEPSKGLHSYRPRKNQQPVRSISGQLPAYKPSGQQTVNSSSKIQPLNRQEQQMEKKP